MLPLVHVGAFSHILVDIGKDIGVHEDLDLRASVDVGELRVGNGRLVSVIDVGVGSAVLYHELNDTVQGLAFVVDVKIVVVPVPKHGGPPCFYSGILSFYALLLQCVGGQYAQYFP